MSDPLRIALIAEGPTDGVVINATLRSILVDRPFVLTQLQPEGSVAFGSAGTGWVGVYRWCKQSSRRGGGKLSDDSIVFENYDVLILHLDADVSTKNYAQGALMPEPTDGELPCAQPCPPASASTNPLRHVLLSWCGEAVAPPHTILCVPSQNTEAWVLAALFPNDQSVLAGDLECHADPESRLGQQPKRVRIRKRTSDYRDRASAISTSWPQIAALDGLTEAQRFQNDTQNAIAAQ